MQRWLSGLRRTIGNRVTVNSRPEVQILFSAPKKAGVFYKFARFYFIYNSFLIFAPNTLNL